MWDFNWPAVEIFLRVQTQWRVIASMAGVMFQGLDYAAALSLIDRRIPEANRNDVFDDLCVMEGAALEVFNPPKEKR